VVIDNPGVRDGERQGAHSILSSDDRRETRVQGKENILGDRFRVVDSVEAQIPENAGRELTVSRGEALSEDILLRLLSV